MHTHDDPALREALRRRPTLGRYTRLALFVSAAGIVGVLATARALRPDPRGFGTHKQLGLPPCGFLGATGVPCPSCGMTTAFAWTTRGRLDRACRSNAAGALLTLSLAVSVPWLLHCGISGRPRWGARSVEGPLIVVIVAAVGTGLAVWTVRLVLWRVLG